MSVLDKYGLNKVISVNGKTLFGSGVCTVMAGPCAVESRDQILYTAEKLKDMGVTVFRAGAFKPRTSYGAFMGAGEEGIKWLEEVREQYGMLIITESSDSANIDAVSETADIVQVGAKAMYNYSVLEKAGKSGKPVLLKRHFGATIDEMVKMSEYIAATGNKNIAFCERGIRTFEQSSRFTLDLCGAEYLKFTTGLPIILDPSHSMGYAYGVPDCAKACAALGCDGILIEVHHNPDEAKCDKEQAIDLDQFKELYSQMKGIGEVIGKKLSDLRYFLIDVDGTLTDSGIYYDRNGNELKKFSTRDAAGILAAHYIGLEILVVTGRECEATSRRMDELKIDYVFQHIKNKKEFLAQFMMAHNVGKFEMGYIGDDLNDYSAMSLAGFIACPNDACQEVRQCADYVSTIKGGEGVVQDVFRYILSELGKWDEFVNHMIEAGY